MVGKRPVSTVPLQAIRPSSQVATVEQHPDETVQFKLFGQRSHGLQELVTIIEPSRLNKATDAENDSGLPKVFEIDENPVSTVKPR